MARLLPTGHGRVADGASEWTRSAVRATRVQNTPWQCTATCEVVEEVDALFLVKHWIRVVFSHQTRGLLVPGKYLVLQEADFI